MCVATDRHLCDSEGSSVEERSLTCSLPKSGPITAAFKSLSSHKRRADESYRAQGEEHGASGLQFKYRNKFKNNVQLQ